MGYDHYSIIPPNPIIFRIGIFAVRWYAVLIFIGIILAIIASIREGEKRGISSELLIDLIFVGVPLSIIGTRLYFILFNNLGWYLRNPIRIIGIYPSGFAGISGLAIHGGIIAAGLYTWWYLKKKDIPALPILDIVAVGFFIGQIVGRFGNFMNQEAHGPAINAESLDAQREFLTSLFIPEFIVNGMFINGNYYHPTFLYEALWNFIGLIIAVFVLRRLSKVLIGEIAAFYAIWYSFGRFFIESLRTDSLMLGSFQIAQVISVVAIVLVVILVIYRRKNEKLLIPYSVFNLQEFNRDRKRSKRKPQKSSNHKNTKNKRQGRK